MQHPQNHPQTVTSRQNRSRRSSRHQARRRRHRHQHRGHHRVGCANGDGGGGRIRPCVDAANTQSRSIVDYLASATPVPARLAGRVSRLRREGDGLVRLRNASHRHRRHPGPDHQARVTPRFGAGETSSAQDSSDPDPGSSSSSSRPSRTTWRSSASSCRTTTGCPSRSAPGRPHPQRNRGGGGVDVGVPVDQVWRD